MFRELDKPGTFTRDLVKADIRGDPTAKKQVARRLKPFYRAGIEMVKRSARKNGIINFDPLCKT